MFTDREICRRCINKGKLSGKIIFIFCIDANGIVVYNKFDSFSRKF
jgi:hypothetical protein